MTISELQNEAFRIADIKGFHNNRSFCGRDDTLIRLCLIHTEISEATQGVKRDWHMTPTDTQSEEFAEELADAMIRIADLAECVGVDLDKSIAKKMAKNLARPHLYGTAESEGDPQLT